MKERKKCTVCYPILVSCDICRILSSYEHYQRCHRNYRAYLPSVDVVEKWKRDDVITFLQKKELNLRLDDKDIGIIKSKQIDGIALLSMTEEKLESYGLMPGPAIGIAIYVKRIKGKQHDIATNIYTQGKKFVSRRENVSENLICIDYGRLIKMVLNGRGCGDCPVIVRSHPPPNDSLRSDLEDLGLEVKVYDKEDKRISTYAELTCFILNAIKEDKRPGVLALIAGNNNYGPMLRLALERGWAVEIWFWSEGTSHHFKHINVPKIINLDPYYTEFTYACGVDIDRNKILLGINGVDWSILEIMKLYVSLGLFCWYYKSANHSFQLYFNNFDQWKRANCWVKEKYPQILEF